MLRAEREGAEHVAQALLLIGRQFGPEGVAHLGMPLGEGSRLVEHHRVNASGRLEALGVAHQNARLGPLADTHHHGRRRGQPQGAGAGNHQHRHRRQHPVREALLGGQEPPCGKGEERHGEDDRHEDAGDAVDQLLDRRAAPLRLAHRTDDVGQQRRIAAPRHLEAEAVAAVDRAGKDAVARMLGTGKRFSREQALVDVRPAGDDPAVGRQPLARTHLDHVARLQRRQGDELHPARPLDAHRCGLQSAQLAHGIRGAPAGPHLEHPPQQDEGHHDARRFEIEVRLDPPFEPEAGEEKVEDAEEVSHSGAGRHERVHVGGAVAELAPGAAEEAAAQHEDHRCREQPQQVTGPRLPAPDHSDDRHGHRQREGPHGTAAQRTVFGFAFALGGVERLVLAGEKQVVARLLHHAAQGLGGAERRVVADAGRRGGIVDRGLGDPLLTAEHLPHPCGAGRTAHARNGEDRIDGAVF